MCEGTIFEYGYLKCYFQDISALPVSRLHVSSVTSTEHCRLGRVCFLWIMRTSKAMISSLYTSASLKLPCTNRSAILLLLVYVMRRAYFL
jgi:hypothetical protein